MDRDISNRRFGKWIAIKFEYFKRHKPYWKCLCDCGTSKPVDYYSLIKGTTKSCGCLVKEINAKKRIDITNKRFGRLVVVKYRFTRKHHSYWLCRCDCGNTKTIEGSTLKNNKTRSCGCLSIENRWSGSYEMSGNFLYSVKRCAEERDLNFDVTHKELWDLYLKQNKQCALSGIQIGFTRQKCQLKKMQTASLDRIDPKKDYTLDNLQWVHKNINRMKWDLHQDDFLHFVYLICNPIIDDGVVNKHSLRMNHYGYAYKGVGNFSASKYYMCEYGAKIRQIDFNISMKDCWDLFVKQNGKCSMTGVRLLMSKAKSNIEYTASLDRINNNIGYNVDNIRWVHKNVNQMKMDSADSDFINRCRIIHSHIYNNKRYEQ